MSQNPYYTVHQLSDQERVDWLRLIRSESVGPKTFWELLRLYQTAEKALQHLPELATKGGRKKSLRICTIQQAEQELERCQRLGARHVMACEPTYPPLLRQVVDAPPVLTMRGQTELLQQPMVALVGARNASANGMRYTRYLAKELGEAGYVVASGLARGVDTAAHTVSLETGTVAVIAGGIDSVYPQENAALYQKIYEQGIVVAEMPVGTHPKGIHFPQRNRIISGMSQIVVVVEAAFKSGSLITARMALEQNREVCAVPGFPLDPRSQGPNRLIQQGATIVTSPRDILDLLESSQMPLQLTEDEPPTFQALGDNLLACEAEYEEARLIIEQYIGASPVSVDEMIRETLLSPALILQILLEFELAGRLERHSGNRVSFIYHEQQLALV